MDNTHAQRPVLKIDGIGILLKYQYPCFGVRPIPPTGVWVYTKQALSLFCLPHWGAVCLTVVVDLQPL